MTELVQLEAAHEQFAERDTRVVVISLEGLDDAQATQQQFPHLVVVSDANRSLAEAVEVIHPNSSIHGGDTTAPTTLLVDRGGIVRWLFRPDRFLTRLSPPELLQAIDAHMPPD
jgi:alkyl hydroperoxide reductase subunit AhpC